MNAPFRVRLLRQAEDDLIAIWQYVAEHNPAAADNLLDRLDKRIGTLADFPERGAPRNELGKGIRLLIEGNYLIVYRFEKGETSIIRVIHGSRDLVNLLKP